MTWLYLFVHRLMRKTVRIAGRGLVYFGGIFLVFIILAFTDLPFWACYHLGTSGTSLEGTPDYIVVMGAGGMPGPDGLMRCYYASEAAKAYPLARIIIALPTLPEYFTQSHTYHMYREMVMRGVDSTRFLFEITGTNTRTQALAISHLIEHHDTCRMLIITSPEHMYRAVRVFRKAGFSDAGGVPSFETDLNESLLLSEAERQKEMLGPNRLPSLRYNLWNYLKYEINFIRETTAIVWYWLNGWI